jgi:regulator of sirC expression with transglutaminase-like and TPR domain
MASAPDLSTLDAFARAVDRHDESIDLGHAALLVAADAYPHLDVDAYLGRLDGLAAPLAGRVTEDVPLGAAVDLVNGHLFGEEGFHGNTEAYYDPRNSYLNEVLDRRTGIPVTLSVVYMEVARRLGLEVVGVGLPGHFVVEARRDGEALLLDPFQGGAALSMDDAERLMEDVYGGVVPFSPELLEPVPKRAILSRILNNLKMTYLAAGDAARAWPVVEKMVHLAPDSPVDRRDRGLVAHRLNRFATARDDLRFYLDRAPGAPDRAAVRGSLEAVEAILAVMGPSP